MDSISLAGTSCDTGNKRMKLEECQGGTVVDKDGHFRVNTHLIQQALVDDNPGSDLQNLGLSVFNQDEFEQGVMKQVDQAIAQEKTEQQKRSLVQELKSIEEDIRLVQDELAHITKSETTRQQENDAAGETVLRLETFHRQRENKLSQLKTLEKRQTITLGKLKKVETSEQKTYSDGAEDAVGQVLGGQGADSNKESEKERMIRLGDMTPFGTVFYMKCSQVTSDLQQFPSRYTGPSAKNESVGDASIPYQLCKVSTPDLSKAASVSRGRPQVRSVSDEKECPLGERKWSLSCTRSHRIRKHQLKTVHNFVEDPDVSSEGHTDNDDSDYEPSISELDMNNFSEPSSNEEEIEGADMRPGGRRNRTVRKRNVVYRKGVDDNNLPSQCVRLRQEKAFVREKDDADENFYMKRLLSHQMTGGSGSGGEGDEEFDEGLVVPGVIWKRLYKYQKTGVRWLWELHCQQAGGIIGDEMGLGKTIQMIAFLAALKNSNLRHKDFKYVGLGPVVVVCPTTVMHQWVQEFHKWWPEFRVAILHSSGSYTGSQAQLVRSVVKGSGILVTSYNTVVNQRDILLPYNWHYIVLDEGHKIRNPDAQMTLCCKQFRTPHRIILSGSPIQNNLKELWSLFDFVFPGKLGTLPDFMANFSVPIVQGGYANATQVQVETAYKCACVLRDTINPYLLRRMKADVKVCLDLPSKSEQVLFCRLTDGQREVYEEYLQSRECQAILAGKYQVFAGLITLRKICNHPDLSTGGPRVLIGQDLSRHDEQRYGFWQRSGKMIVVEALLKLWHRQGQRVLFFTQSRAMLDIIEGFVQDSQYIYLRMDGTTPISSRQPLISQFNKDSSVFVFLLTTRVGGLGVNLTGANRVIIYDPDWNPSTDAQARERAWRIGQKRQVTVYRLLTSGTIEEKIYHRQIFKQFLTNRILKDPKQRRFFKSNDVFELFTLGSKDDRGTETSAIFAGTGSDVKMPQQCAVSPMPTSKTLKSNRVDVMKKGQTSGQEESFCTDLDHSELERMHELARKLSRKMEEEKLRNLKGSRENNTNSDCVSKTDAEPIEKHSTSTDVTNAQHHPILKGNKNKKNTKNAKFEGQRIPHLVKSSNSTLFPRVEEDGDRASRLQDDYVLHKLFKKTGIQSVMKHDKIMDSSRADFALVEAEAIKVAKEAAAALRRSRAMCLPAMSGIPTWTGQHGGSSVRQRFGQKKNSLFISKYEESSTPVKETFTKRQMSLKKPKGKAKTMFDGSQAGSVALSSTQDVVSSSELLSDMHRRQKLSTDKLSMDASENSSSRSNEIDAKDHELIEDIRNFIAFMGDTNGQATTEELMTNFGPRLPKSDSAKFKAMLVQICDFKKTHGTGVWRLKQDFW